MLVAFSTGCRLSVLIGAALFLPLGCENPPSVRRGDSGGATSCGLVTSPLTIYTATGGVVAQPVISQAAVVIATTNAVGAVPFNGGAYDVLAEEVSPHGRLARSALSGGDTMTLLDKEPISLAVVNGTIVFSLGTEIDAIGTGGGQPRTIASGLVNAGMIAVLDRGAVWVDPTDQIFGDATSPKVTSACLDRY